MRDPLGSVNPPTTTSWAWTHFSFSQSLLRRGWYAELRRLAMSPSQPSEHAAERPRSPFAGTVKERAVHWVEPTMVVQVGFGEWTSAGHLRHPRYLGRRPDKDPQDVIREP